MGTTLQLSFKIHLWSIFVRVSINIHIRSQCYVFEIRWANSTDQSNNYLVDHQKLKMWVFLWRSIEDPDSQFMCSSKVTLPYQCCVAYHGSWRFPNTIYLHRICMSSVSVRVCTSGEIKAALLFEILLWIEVQLIN